MRRPEGSAGGRTAPRPAVQKGSSAAPAGYASHQLRHRIARRLPAPLRSAIKRSLSTAGAARAYRPQWVTAARWRAVEAEARTIVVGSGGDALLGRVREEALTALGARTANLLEVTSTLEGAGIPYFAVRGTDPRRAVVAVHADDADAAFAQLSAHLRRTGGQHVVLNKGLRLQKARVQPLGRRVRAPVARTDAVVMFWNWTDPDGRALMDAAYGCDVEVWRPDGLGGLLAPRPNLVSEILAEDEETVRLSDSCFTSLAARDGDPLPEVATRLTFTARRPDDIIFPVDAVFTWVDGADEQWQRRRSEVTHVAYHDEADNDARYLDREELRYALRSIETYAPWIRTIYLVTDRQVPPWLRQDVPGLRVVDHTEIFSDPAALPTFNSHAIESQLHHIEGLSEHFLYFNDDMMLGRAVIPQTFFTSNGLAQFFPSPATIPFGDPRATDVPVTIAAKNNRVLLQKRFGWSLTNKIKHAPYALRRSVLFEIESEFPEQHRRTMHSRVRDASDYSIVSSLHHWYAFATSRSAVGRISYRYVDLDLEDAVDQLGIVLAERRHDALCLNTTGSLSENLPLDAMRSFCEAYFPTPSRWER